ncbi:MAG: trypsin-like peptidase domain-containing protein [Clostridia bacterium]|nr:trypsin-like peptidase domain-containing protein [Clostridia bacterium]
MKRRMNSHRVLIWITSLALVCAFGLVGVNAGIFVKNAAANAEVTMVSEPAGDPSPAIYVMQRNANSVVGVIGYIQEWNRNTGNVEETMYAQGSGVVIAEGGYILTNNHVVEASDSYKILMPSGDKVEAHLVGADDATDMAVLRVNGDENQLVPVTVGSSANIIVGSTAIAIGNPSGLVNSVTQGIVSALERSDVYSDNTSRNVDYIQHDAAINSGSSGGGLFNYKGELIGINTLKKAGVSYEGLSFAIPIDSAYPIAMQLIENGKVIRPQMGISVSDYEGPDEPMGNYPPASVCIYEINEGGPADRAGLKLYDFIYAVNGERVTTFRELTAVLDKFQAGDTVTLTVVRYNNVYPIQQQNYNSYNPFGGYFGYDFGFGYGYEDGQQQSGQSGVVTDLSVGGGYDYITVDVTLELPAEIEN